MGKENYDSELDASYKFKKLHSKLSALGGLDKYRDLGNALFRLYRRKKKLSTKIIIELIQTEIGKAKFTQTIVNGNEKTSRHSFWKSRKGLSAITRKILLDPKIYLLITLAPLKRMIRFFYYEFFIVKDQSLSGLIREIKAELPGQRIVVIDKVPVLDKLIAEVELKNTFLQTIRDLFPDCIFVLLSTQSNLHSLLPKDAGFYISKSTELIPIDEKKLSSFIKILNLSFSSGINLISSLSKTKVRENLYPHILTRIIMEKVFDCISTSNNTPDIIVTPYLGVFFPDEFLIKLSKKGPLVYRYNYSLNTIAEEDDFIQQLETVTQFPKEIPALNPKPGLPYTLPWTFPSSLTRLQSEIYNSNRIISVFDISPKSTARLSLDIWEEVKYSYKDEIEYYNIFYSDICKLAEEFGFSVVVKPKGSAKPLRADYKIFLENLRKRYSNFYIEADSASSVELARKSDFLFAMCFTSPVMYGPRGRSIWYDHTNGGHKLHPAFQGNNFRVIRGSDHLRKWFLEKLEIANI